MKYFWWLVILGGLLGVSLIFLVKSNQIESVKQVKAESLEKEVVVKIEPNMTFSKISEEVGLGGTLMNELFTASQDVYDLSLLKVGRDIKFYFSKQTNELKKIIYAIDTEEELFLTTNASSTWQAARKKIDYEIRVRTVSGSIESSLYESALEQNLDVRAIIDLADVFAWTVDFGMGIRQGDTYKFIFEERYREGQYVMPGKIIAAKFVNDGKIIEGYYFLEGQDKDGQEMDGYYDPEGNSLQKIFLKSPVSYKYISSYFTTGLRYVEAFNVSTGHRAVDYAAPAGTPVRTVGDGQIVYAGWNNKGYGNMVTVRHNSIYTTNYGHFSKIYVRYGQSVKQGDIIGAVGSTGFSTGPHLHFEMVKNGTKINPLTMDLPADKAVEPANLERFKATIKSWQEKLNN
jgi:murein DD-endopeptidase MepM/ murein hydrolase activator NlpD